MAPMQRRAGWIAALALGLATASGCRQILGIEERSEKGLGTSGGGGSPAVSCDAYCDEIAAACSGADVQQYASSSTCEKVCAQVDVGKPGDLVGNNVTCRLTAARKASQTGNTEELCPVAGPAGDGVCGSICESYCGLLDRICPGSFPDVFADVGTCLEECASLPHAATAFSTSVPSGNTIECRLFHLTLASENPVPHCEHAQGKSLCAPPP